MSEGERILRLPLGVPQFPPDFPDRLDALKERTGMSWERMAATLGVDSRQLHRWRKGTVPGGQGMLSLVRLAARVPDGLAELLDEDVRVVPRHRDG